MADRFVRQNPIAYGETPASSEGVNEDFNDLFAAVNALDLEEEALGDAADEHEALVLDPTDTNTDKTKHLSNAQAKVWQDHVGSSASHLPAISAGDAGKVLKVNTGETAYEKDTVANALNVSGLTEKTTPADGDVFPGADSAASNALKKFSWANIKATLKAYMDTLYILKSLGTAKGDIIVFTASGTPARIGVGTNDYIPIADSEETGGIRWGIVKIVGDTAPKLGGDLDVNGNKIVSVSNGNIEITPNGTGQIKMGKAARFDTLLSNGAASCTIDWRLNNKQIVTPDGDRTYAFTGTDGPSSFTLWITVTAARTLTWPASVSWRGGAPDISAAGTFIATFAWNGVDTYIGTCTGKD